MGRIDLEVFASHFGLPQRRQRLYYVSWLQQPIVFTVMLGKSTLPDAQSSKLCAQVMVSREHLKSEKAGQREQGNQHTSTQTLPRSVAQPCCNAVATMVQLQRNAETRHGMFVVDSCVQQEGSQFSDACQALALHIRIPKFAWEWQSNIGSSRQRVPCPKRKTASHPAP